MIVILVLTTLSAAVIGAGNLVVSASGTMIGVLGSLLYVPLVLFLLRLSPMWPRGTGVGWVFSALLWGSATATTLAHAVGGPVNHLGSKLGAPALNASFGGAYPEEFLKGLGVFFVLLAYRKLARPWHGFIVGAVVGLGFETYENVLYGAMGAIMDANSDVWGALQMWGLRLVFGPALHIIFTAMVGWGIGWALFGADLSLGKRILFVLRWWALSFCLHFCWNISWTNDTWQIIGAICVGVVLYPVFISLLWRGYKMAKRDEPPIYLDRPLTTLAQLEAVRQR